MYHLPPRPTVPAALVSSLVCFKNVIRFVPPVPVSSCLFAFADDDAIFVVVLQIADAILSIAASVVGVVDFETRAVAMIYRATILMWMSRKDVRALTAVSNATATGLEGGALRA